MLKLRDKGRLNAGPLSRVRCLRRLAHGRRCAGMTCGEVQETHKIERYRLWCEEEYDDASA